MAQLYAQVIIPRPLDGAFTYSVPAEMQSRVGVGYRVIVSFGPRRFLTGIIESLSPIRPTDVADIKPISDVLDEHPVVKPLQLKLWHWIADYYMCAIGDVMKAALPGGMRVESETVVETVDNDTTREALAGADDDDACIINFIASKPRVTLKDLAKGVACDNLETRIARLVESGVLSVHESLLNRYRRVKVRMLELKLPRGDQQALDRAFESVKRSQGQQEALMQLIAMSGYNQPARNMSLVRRDMLLDEAEAVTGAHIDALRRKGLVEEHVREVSRFAPIGDDDPMPGELPVLSDAQQAALRAIHTASRDKQVTLLRGVTSSGKTEIYMHLIDYTLRQGKQALMLVPEIALTTQLTRRLQRVFGSKVRIYHSKFSDNERVDIWRDMLRHGGPCVVIGARSAVFLPFTAPGLVIVDEEHDPSYKQSDPAPRYNGRDTAIIMASMHGAKVVLGSATPSVETYYKATEGSKYGLVELTERYGDAMLPRIEVVDMARERLKHHVTGVLAQSTIARTRNLIADGKQAIFFHNRRGFSPRARCRLCQFTPKCEYCDVSLTYHKRTSTLECHYCGATYPVPKVCPACHEPTIEIEGYGTERIEDGMAAIFPEARIMRMDLDTTRNKEAYANLIDDFSQRKADILVGTQMVTKGLDFKDVGIVTVVNADTLINFPDYRANERAFNLMEQVAGRAGRRSETPGTVVIQTYTPDNPVIGFVQGHDYLGFYGWELAQRHKLLYPPYARIINIYLRHRDRATVEHVASAYAARLRQLLGNRINGPVEPEVERVASQYIRKIMLKIEHTASVFKVKDVLRGVYLEFNASPVKSGVTVTYDVDPV